jgi:hypothetical protein
MNGYLAVLNVVVWLKNPEGAYLIDARAPFIMTLGTNLLLMFLTGSLRTIKFELVLALTYLLSSRSNMV